MTRKNFAYFSISNTPGTSGNLTVSTAVDALHVTLGSGDDGGVFSCRIFEAGVGSEIRTGCTYTHGTTTLTRGTLESSTTGSALNFTSAAKVQVVASAADYTGLDQQLARGIVIVRNDGSKTLSLAASTFTKLTPINSEEYDPNGWWDNANQRFQPTRAGRYLIVAGSQITFSSTSLVSYMIVARKNGSDFAHLARGWILGAGNVGVSGSCVTNLNGSSDYIEPFGWQNDTESRATVAGAERQYFMAIYLGAS